MRQNGCLLARIMTGGQHRTNPQHIQHAQPLLDPSGSHRIFHEQGYGSLNGSSPAVMEENAFQDFTFPFAGIDQSRMLNMPDISFSNHMGADVAQHPGLNTNGPPMIYHTSVMPGPPNSNSAFGADPSHRGTSSDVVEDGSGERISPTEHSFEDASTDEFGLPGNNRADGTDLGGKKNDDKSSAPPAWSELKTKAGKDRKRLPLACIACRRKKIRCSGEKPACKHCLRSRIPCVYKVTTRKAAPRTDYMAMLDKRLKRMEDRIIKIIPKSDQDAASSIIRATVKPAVLGSNAGNKVASKKRGTEEAFGADLESWAKTSVDFRCVDRMDEELAIKDGRISEEDLLFLEGIDALPSKEVQEHLAEVFFDNVYGQAYHLLHKPSYMRKLKNNTLPPVLILSVCAVAARFATQPNIAGTARPFLRGEEWASQARDICTRRYEWPNMTLLTCLLILSLHEFGTCHGGRSWALGGQAIRMAFALQLHRDVEHVDASSSKSGSSPPLSFVDREIRRRIMWACFLMDRFNSSGSDRPMFIKEASIRIQLPVKESYFQLDIPAQTELLYGSAGQSEPQSDRQKASLEDNMGVAAYTIRVIAIWGRIVAYLHHDEKGVDHLPPCNEQSTYAKLVQQVDDLQCNLPESLRYSVNNLNLHMTEKTASQFLLMHLSVQQNALFLHKAATTWATKSGGAGEDATSEFLARVSAKTVAAANTISQMLKDAEQCKCNMTAPFAGYCAFSATNVHILSIFSGNAATKAAAEVNAGINIKFLRKMMRYWGMFHWMVEHIRTQYRNALEASRSGKTCTPDSEEWLTLQYADWFNKYPYGVSELDVGEPTAKRRRQRGENAVLEQKPELHSVGDYFTSLTSPSSTEGAPPAAHGLANKRRHVTNQSSDSAVGNGANNGKPSDAKMAQSATGPLNNPGRRPTSGQPRSASVGGQPDGPASAGYSSMPLAHVQNQPYAAAMPPVSPVQASPYPPPGPGQSPFYGSDMLQMGNVGHRGTEDVSPNMDSRVPFGYGLSGGQNMMNSGAANWQAKHVLDNNKMLDHNQQAIKVNSRHPPTRHVHSQGQVGPDGLVEFNDSNLPAGWFMPFSMDQRANFQDLSIPKESEAADHVGAVDPFNSMFGINGMGPHQTMDGLRHTL